VLEGIVGFVIRGIPINGDVSDKSNGFWLWSASSSNSVNGGNGLVSKVGICGTLTGVERSVCLVEGAMFSQNPLAGGLQYNATLRLCASKQDTNNERGRSGAQATVRLSQTESIGCPTTGLYTGERKRARLRRNT
jgi:hypothetical protein